MTAASAKSILGIESADGPLASAPPDADRRRDSLGRQAEDACDAEIPEAAEQPLMRVDRHRRRIARGSSRTKDRAQQTDRRLLSGLCFACVRKPRSTTTSDKLREALKLLEFERETWRLACDKFASQGRSRFKAFGQGRRPTIIGQHLAMPNSATHLSLDASPRRRLRRISRRRPSPLPPARFAVLTPGPTASRAGMMQHAAEGD